jgi:hypothetical protein
VSGLVRARRYGLESEYDLLRFLNVMFFFGAELDPAEFGSYEEPPLVAAILKSSDAPATTRMNLLMEEIFTRFSRSDAPSTEGSASPPAEPPPFDGIEWKDDLPSDYKPQSITPQIEPFQLPPFPNIAATNTASEGSV